MADTGGIAERLIESVLTAYCTSSKQHITACHLDALREVNMILRQAERHANMNNRLTAPDPAKAELFDALSEACKALNRASYTLYEHGVPRESIEPTRKARHLAAAAAYAAAAARSAVHACRERGRSKGPDPRSFGGRSRQRSGHRVRAPSELP